MNTCLEVCVCRQKLHNFGILKRMRRLKGQVIIKFGLLISNNYVPILTDLSLLYHIARIQCKTGEVTISNAPTSF